MFKIATWNVNSLRVRLEHVTNWLRAEQPDVLAMQETKVTDDDFPQDAFRDLGYRVLASGQKTYNGVAILSREPATDLLRELPGYPDPQRRVLLARIGKVSILNLYIPNGSEVGSEKYRYKLDWLSALRGLVESLLKEASPLVVLGDFNIAPAPADVHDPALWEGKVLFSEPERAAFNDLITLGLVDCFRLFPDAGECFSWWDYRAAAFRRNLGLRIDHILASRALADSCRACRIDRGPRGWERPSDHAPVVAEFALDG